MSEVLSTTEQKVLDKRLKNLRPGQSPGKPKGRKDDRTIFREAMAKIAEADGLTAEDVEIELAKVGIEKAKKGDFAYWKEIHDRLHGKAIQRTENKNLNADLNKLQEDEKSRLDELIK